MKAPSKKILVTAAFIFLNAGIAHAANVEQMLEKCRSQAAKKLKVPGSEVQVKYEGQRTDMTHAVNGSTLVRGQSETFQCSFEPKGRRIAKFVVNSPQPVAKTNAAVDESSVTSLYASPEEGGPRNWEVAGVSRTLNIRERPSVRAGIVAIFTRGTILGNLGCQRAEGHIWCDVQRFGGGPRGYVAAKFLKPAVSPDGSVAMGPDDSSLRAGRGKFDATGYIPCAQVRDQPMTKCEFGVARAGGGYATVVIKRTHGGSRAIFFQMGIPIGADTSQADGYGEFRATREGSLHMIRVGDERYEIPDAVVLGG